MRGTLPGLLTAALALVPVCIGCRDSSRAATSGIAHDATLAPARDAGTDAATWRSDERKRRWDSLLGAPAAMTEIVASACMQGRDLDFGDGIFVWSDNPNDCQLVAEPIDEFRGALSRWGSPEPGTMVWVDRAARRTATAHYYMESHPPVASIRWASYTPLEEIVRPSERCFAFEPDCSIGIRLAELPSKFSGRGDTRFVHTPKTALGGQGLWILQLEGDVVVSWRWQPNLLSDARAEHRRLIDMIDHKLGPSTSASPTSREYLLAGVRYRMELAGDQVREIQAFGLE